MIDLLVLIPLPEVTRNQLAGTYRLHDLPKEGSEREKMLNEIGPIARAIVTGSRGYVTDELLARLPALEHVACFTAGEDMVDKPAVEKRGLTLSNNSAALADSVADLGMALLMALMRNVIGADAHVRAGRWPAGRYGPGSLMAARRMGVVGLGRIGHGIARRAEGFGTEIGYHGRSKKTDTDWAFFPDVTEMAKWADILVITMPGGPETDGMITAKVIDALGPDGMLVNVARGSLVDQDALVDALANGRISGAALDVFANEPNVPEELIAMENVVLSPHQGSNTREALDIRSVYLRHTLDELFPQTEGVA